MDRRMRHIACVLCAVLVLCVAVPAFAAPPTSLTGAAFSLHEDFTFGADAEASAKSQARATDWQSVQSSYPNVEVQPLLLTTHPDGWTWDEVVDSVLATIADAGVVCWAYSPDGEVYDGEAVLYSQVSEGSHLVALDYDNDDVCFGLWTIYFVADSPKDWETTKENYSFMQVRTVVLRSYPEGWTWSELADFIFCDLGGKDIAWYAYSPAGNLLDTQDVADEVVPAGAHLLAVDTSFPQRCYGLWDVRVSAPGSSDPSVRDKVSAWDIVQSSQADRQPELLLLKAYDEGWRWDELTDLVLEHLSGTATQSHAYSAIGEALGDSQVVSEQVHDGEHLAVFERDNPDHCYGLWTIRFSGPGSSDPLAHSKPEAMTLTRLVNMAQDYVAGRAVTLSDLVRAAARWSKNQRA